MLLNKEAEIEILKEAVCLSLNVNVFEKAMKRFVRLIPSYSKLDTLDSVNLVEWLVEEKVKTLNS